LLALCLGRSSARYSRTHRRQGQQTRRPLV
jgi:hypothetical protein